MSIFSFIKVAPNRFLFMSYAGKQYSCNPRAISEFIENYQISNSEIIWVISQENSSLLNGHNVKTVQPRNLKFYYYHWTAQFIITNGITFKEIPIRKNQRVINTWHGGGAYKKIVFDNPSLKRSYFEKKNIDNPYEKRTIYLSSCKSASENVIRSGLRHKGVILETGSPRNDIFFKENSFVKKRVIDYYNIPSDKKILLYAPTFRDAKDLSTYDIDFNAVCNALTEKFKGDWIVMTRMHQLLFESLKLPGFIDASNYPDMQDLLVCADAFITDYSSSIWDYSFTYKPGFIYASDLNDYTKERDFYTNISDWPYEFASDTEQLIKNIQNYNEIDSIEKIKRHHKKLQSFENGNASKKLLDYLEGTFNENN